MAQKDREPNPQEAQRDGQSAISQDNPLQELHQEGEGNTHYPVVPPVGTSELTDDEISVLCDIERTGSVMSNKEALLAGLAEGGFITSSDKPLSQLKITSRAQQLLSKREIGLNKS